MSYIQYAFAILLLGMIFAIFCVVHRLQDRSRWGARGRWGAVRGGYPRLSAEIFRRLKFGTLDYSLSEEHVEQNFPITEASKSETCIICLCEVEVGDPIRTLQCHHNFHPNCISTWFLHKPDQVPQCPTCRESQDLAQFHTEEENETAQRPEVFEEASAISHDSITTVEETYV
mmetsp:Transcript_92112/g.159927  ORF Transcript_92112/g.159927 Transcript_92112/m.159927 type:complete len:173 (-) Transcript_92112:168-686(-)